MGGTSRHPDRQDRLEAVLREHQKIGRRFDNCLEDLAEYFRKNLPEATRQLLVAIPEHREVWRQEALEKYGYDLERHKWTIRPEETIKCAEDAGGLIALVNHYATCRFVMELWESFVQDGLRGEQLQGSVCGSVIEAYRQRPGLAAKGVEALEAGMPGFPQGLALSVYLTTHVVTHTSLHKNLRLRAGIDELREPGESRFTRLLKELPAEALAAYRARGAGRGDLMDVRAEATRRLEKRNAPPEIGELATFANRENLLKRAKAARLSSQELEVFELYIENPKLKYREIADRLGISTSQVGVIKHRIKTKLTA